MRERFWVKHVDSTAVTVSFIRLIHERYIDSNTSVSGGALVESEKPCSSR